MPANYSIAFDSPRGAWFWAAFARVVRGKEPPARPPLDHGWAPDETSARVAARAALEAAGLLPLDHEGLARALLLRSAFALDGLDPEERARRRRAAREAAAPARAAHAAKKEREAVARAKAWARERVAGAAAAQAERLLWREDVGSHRFRALFEEWMRLRGEEPGERRDRGAVGDGGASPDAWPPAAGAYRSLGLAPTADATEIKRAYRRLALVHHPDRGGTGAAFIALTRQYRAALAHAERSAGAREARG